MAARRSGYCYFLQSFSIFSNFNSVNKSLRSSDFQADIAVYDFHIKVFSMSIVPASAFKFKCTCDYIPCVTTWRWPMSFSSWLFIFSSTYYYNFPVMVYLLARILQDLDFFTVLHKNCNIETQSTARQNYKIRALWTLYEFLFFSNKLNQSREKFA